MLSRRLLLSGGAATVAATVLGLKHETTRAASATRMWTPAAPQQWYIQQQLDFLIRRRMLDQSTQCELHQIAPYGWFMSWEHEGSYGKAIIQANPDNRSDLVPVYVYSNYFLGYNPHALTEADMIGAYEWYIQQHGPMTTDHVWHANLSREYALAHEWSQKAFELRNDRVEL